MCSQTTCSVWRRRSRCSRSCERAHAAGGVITSGHLWEGDKSADVCAGGGVSTGTLLGEGVTSRGTNFLQFQNVRWLSPSWPVQVLHRKGEHLARAATSKKPTRNRARTPQPPPTPPPAPLERVRAVKSARPPRRPALRDPNCRPPADCLIRHPTATDGHHVSFQTQ